jgi:MFS transporter (putative signal transducer)
LVLACLTVVAFAASTVDIACDGYAVESLARKFYGWGNAAQVGGAYLGSAIGGGLFLILVTAIGWRHAAWSMALLLVLLGIPFLLHARGQDRHAARSHVPSLASALKRPDIRRGLVATAVYVLAQKVALGMLGPFLIDAGFDLATVGLLNGLGSMLIGFTAALLGGKLVRAWGTRRVLLTTLALQAVALAIFAFHGISSSVPQPVLIAVAVASASGLMPLGFVALYAQFMEWSDPRQGGIDFTLFQSMDALVSMIGGVAAGYVANAFGYGVFFAAASAIALASLPAIGLVIRASAAGPRLEKAFSL